MKICRIFLLLMYMDVNWICDLWRTTAFFWVICIRQATRLVHYSASEIIRTITILNLQTTDITRLKIQPHTQTFSKVEEWKTNLMSLAILFHFLCAQHVSDINISIITSLRLFCWITTFVVLFLVRCVLEFRCGWVGVVSVLQAEAVLISLLMRSTCFGH